jgi:hydroxylaminobenzene mutase
MDVILYRLCFSGLLLFVVGLMLGFTLQVFPNPRAALSAHLNGVQSGTFLIALGLLWPRLAVWAGTAPALSHAIWVSFWVLEAGMVMGACAPADAGPIRQNRVKLVAVSLQASSSVVMLLAVGALLFTGRNGLGA